MTNEQKAYINKLINFYDHQAKLCSETAKRSWETFNSDMYSSYLEKATMYDEMKSDLKTLLAI